MRSRAYGQAQTRALHLSSKIEKAASFGAFAVATFALSWQVWDALKGARVQVLTPDEFVLYGQSDDAGKPMIRIAAPITYLNGGAPQYASVITKEAVILQLNDLQTSEMWNGIGKLTPAKPASLDKAWPKPVAGQSGGTDVVLFIRNKKRCEQEPCDRTTGELRPRELLDRAKTGAQLTLYVYLTDLSGKIHRSACQRVIDAAAMDELQRLPSKYAEIRCVPAAHAPDDKNFIIRL